VVSVKIERSGRELSDKAFIELPLSFALQNKERRTTEKTFKRGDAVTIELGYDNKNIIEFTGFVKEISAKQTAVLECENSMFLLRKPLKDMSWKNTDLKTVLKYIAGGFGVQMSGECPKIEFSNFVIKKCTGIQALQKLKDEYGLTIFMDYDNKLYAGLAYVYNSGKLTYNMQRNVVSSDLTFKNEEDIQMKIRAVSMLRNNTKLEVETGDKDGEQRTLYFYDIKSKTELERLAKEEIKKYKYTGYSGSLTAFGIPTARFGMTATIKDKNYPEREGKYYVESVRSEFSTSGFRRTVELGVKL
jgi:phage host-nuclease inhibitor protein Gam